MDKKWGDTSDEEDYVPDNNGVEEIPEDHVVTSISTQDVCEPWLDLASSPT